MNEQDLTRSKILGVLIRDARQHAGRSLEECARVLQITPERLREAEQGQQVLSLPALEVLSIYLDIPMAHFWGTQTLGDAEEPPFGELLALRHKIVGVLLRRARTEAGMDAAALAEAADVDAEQLDLYERGQEPIPYLELERMARALDVSVRSFADEERGPLGRHEEAYRRKQQFEQLPPEIQAFVTNPSNVHYIKTAMELSEMDADRLRTIAESLLEITF